MKRMYPSYNKITTTLLGRVYQHHIKKSLWGALTSPKGWDATAVKMASFSKQGFTQGYGKDAWDSIVTKREKARVLDIACGAGSLAIPLAQELQETGGYVLATDFSPKMIEATQAAIDELKLTNIEARVEDGQDMHVPDNSFDYAISIFGVIFFPNLEKGISEIFRVLKSGGKVAIASWHDNLIINATGVLLKKHNKEVPLPFMALGDKDFFEKKLTEAGFTDVKVFPVTKTMPLPSLEGFVTTMEMNPGFVATRELLNLTAKEFADEIVPIMKELAPTAVWTAYIGIGTKK